MNEVREDCFAYNKENKDCDAFTELFCEYKECKFYQEKPVKRALERDIREYSEKCNKK